MTTVGDLSKELRIPIADATRNDEDSYPRTHRLRTRESEERSCVESVAAVPVVDLHAQAMALTQRPRESHADLDRMAPR